MDAGYLLVINVFSIALLCNPYSLMAKAKESSNSGNNVLFRDTRGVPHSFFESDAKSIGKRISSWQFCQRLGKRCTIYPLQTLDFQNDTVTATFNTIVAERFCLDNRQVELTKNKER